MDAEQTPLMEWLTNAHETTVMFTLQNIGWRPLFPGKPKPSDTYTVEQLERMGFFGLYQRTQHHGR